MAAMAPLGFANSGAPTVPINFASLAPSQGGSLKALSGASLASLTSMPGMAPMPTMLDLASMPGMAPMPMPLAPPSILMSSMPMAAATSASAPARAQPAPIAEPEPDDDDEPVEVTEVDRVAWMRQFLHALEQWKTCLDGLMSQAVRESARASMGGSNNAPPLLPDLPPGPPSAMMVGQSSACGSGAGVAHAGIPNNMVMPSFSAGAFQQDPAALAQQMQFAMPQQHQQHQPQHAQQYQFWEAVSGSGSKATEKKRTLDAGGEELCADFKRGDCRRGVTCRYSHGEQDALAKKWKKDGN